MIHQDVLKIEGYTIHHLLGKGGMSSVYLATQESLGRKVAIKVLRETGNEEFRERFVREGKFIAALNHPNIITIHDIGQLKDGRYYIAMEYVEGGDLTQYENQQLPPKVALTITKQIADVLHVVHANGIVHRDIKPANILFRKNGTVILSDFGIAKELKGLDSDITQEGAALGSPSYSSPEQSLGKEIDFRSDFYSLGVVLLQMLTGQNFFKGDTYTETVVNHFQLNIPNLKPPLDVYQSLINSLLAKDPNGRPKTAKDISYHLSRLIKALNQPKKDVARIELDDNLEVVFEQPISEKKAEPKLKPEPKPRPYVKPKRKIGYGKLAGIFGCVFLIVFAALLYLNRPANKVDSAIQALLDKAELQVQNKQYDQPEKQNAAYFYQQVLMQDPGNTQANKGISDIVSLLNRKAEERFDKGQITSPSPYSAYDFYQRALKLDKGDDKAKQGVQQVIRHLLDQAATYSLSGKLTEPAGKNAYDLYQKVLKIDSKHQQAINGVSNIIGLLIQRAEKQIQANNILPPGKHNAVDTFNKVLFLEPENEQAKAGLNTIMATLQKQADTKFEQAHLIAPTKENAYDLYKRILAIDSQYEPAQKGVAKVISALLAKGNERLAASRLTLPKKDNAIYYYQQVLALEKSNSEALKGIQKAVNQLLALANKNYQKGRLYEPKRENAYSLYKKVLRIDQKNAVAKSRSSQIINLILEKAESRLKADKLSSPPLDNAIYYFRLILKLEPSSPVAKQGVKRVVARYIELVRQAHARKRYGSAHKLIDSGLKVEPNNKTLLALQKEIRKPNLLERFIGNF